MVTSGGVFQKIFRPSTAGEESAWMRQLSDRLDRAGMALRPRDIVLRISAVTAVLWIALGLLMRPGMLFAAILLLICAAVATGGFSLLLQMKIRKRLDQFVQQLEMALRLIGSGVRIGLALRQALTMVTEEMPDPARHEYVRVVGQTNIGVSVYDALDMLAKRMPSNETLMMARAIRIQSQTGGDLAKILEHLADTIKERRRIQRKISALTAEGRASAMILSSLPPVLTIFLSITEPPMGHALWFTVPGHISLFIVAVLEGLGTFWLLRMLKVDV
jgi:tight adherence protein B